LAESISDGLLSLSYLFSEVAEILLCISFCGDTFWPNVAFWPFNHMSVWPYELFSL